MKQLFRLPDSPQSYQNTCKIRKNCPESSYPNFYLLLLFFLLNHHVHDRDALLFLRLSPHFLLSSTPSRRVFQVLVLLEFLELFFLFSFGYLSRRVVLRIVLVVQELLLNRFRLFFLLHHVLQTVDFVVHSSP